MPSRSTAKSFVPTPTSVLTSTRSGFAHAMRATRRPGSEVRDTISAVAAFWYEGLPLIVAFQRIVSGITVFSLLAIPFFIFAGELMFHGGIAARLVRFASSLVGAVRGGPDSRPFK